MLCHTVLQCHAISLLSCLRHARRPLRRDRHKGKFICIERLREHGQARFAVIDRALAVRTGAVGLAADRAARLPHGAANGDLLLDAALDVRDQVGVALRAQHIGLGHQAACAVVLADDLRVKNARDLPVGRPLVVADAGLAAKQLRHARQGRRVKALKIAVGPVVAQAHAEAVDGLRRERRARIGVDLCEPGLVRRSRAAQPALLANLHVMSPFSAVPSGRGTGPPAPPRRGPAG